MKVKRLVMPDFHHPGCQSRQKKEKETTGE